MNIYEIKYLPLWFYNFRKAINIFAVDKNCRPIHLHSIFKMAAALPGISIIFLVCSPKKIKHLSKQTYPEKNLAGICFERFCDQSSSQYHRNSSLILDYKC